MNGPPSGGSAGSWTVGQVAAWLKSNMLEKYEKTFFDNDITGEVLLELNHQVLKEMKVASVGDRVRILVAVKSLRKTILRDDGTGGAKGTLIIPSNLSNSPGGTRLRSNAWNLVGSPHQHYQTSNLRRQQQNHPNFIPSSSPGFKPSLQSRSMQQNGRGPLENAKMSGKSPPASPQSPDPRDQESSGTDHYYSPPALKQASNTSAKTLAPTPSPGFSSMIPGIVRQANSKARMGAPGFSQQQAHSPRSPRHAEDEGVENIAESGLRTLDSKRMNFIRVVGDDGEFRVVNLTPQQSANTNLLLARVLEKFNLKGDDPSKYAIWVSSGNDGTARAISNDELLDIVGSQGRPERDRLILRKRHQPLSAEESRRRTEERAKTAKLANFFGERPPAAGSHHKLRKFFGERPPSELISNNLQDFFPAHKLKTVEEERKRRSRASSDANTLRRSVLGESNWRRVSNTPSILSNHSSVFGKELAKDKGLLHEPRDPRQEPVSSARPEDDSGSRESLRENSGREGLRPANSTGALNRIEDAADIPEHEGSSERVPEPGLPEKPEGDHDDVTATEEVPMRWIRGALIGQGSFGSVFLGMNALSGELMAVKRVELPTEDSVAVEKKKMMVDVLQHEINLLKDLDHENIVRYLDSQKDDGYLNIFLEYVPGGSVTALLNNYGSFGIPLVKNFVRQVLLGLNYLHERDIIHRDIKGGNILVDNKGVVKISDFGISKKVEDDTRTAVESLQGGSNQRASLQGSVYWMAPEVVKQMRYTRKADIWSFGCLVIEMISGTHPWPSIGQVEAIFKIGSYAIPEIPPTATDEGREFLLQTFQLDYQMRPTAETLLKHPFAAPL